MTREYEGTGPGLAITSKLFELLGGKCEVKSKLGEGSEFIATIILALGDENKITTEGEEDVYAGFENIKHHILLVEDNAINQKVAKMLLRKFGYECDVANDGLEAIDAVSKDEYSLVLMDIQMPKKNGIDATKDIIKKLGDKSPPIVAMTANAFGEDRERCLKAGMKEFLSKPISKVEMSNILRKYGQ
jgi:CheY-like chemotaxis protein